VGQELVSAYRGADSFVFASLTETQGLVVLEAMAAGLPVAALEAPGVVDIVRHGVNGFLAPFSDPGLLAECVVRLLRDTGLRRQFSDAALDTARQHSIANTTRQIEDVYEFAVAHPHTGREQRFLMLREFVRYQFERLRDGVDDYLL
jgi:glycosyltransferase involved in cell wall biosynthesis